mgnify:CR=1 FL=1
MKRLIETKCASFVVMALLLAACSGTPSSSSQYHDDVVVDIPDDDGMGGLEEESVDDDEEESAEPSDNEADFQLTGIIETCQHCMGYGIVQDGLSGVAKYCKFCGGQRVVDAAVNQLPDDFFERISEQGGSTASDYGMDKEQIAAEIERLEEDIAQMEHQLEYIEGGMQSNYLRQQIIIERNEVKRLQRMLNGY